MTAILFLFAAGIVLLALDIFAASFVLAGMGGAVMLGGAALAWQRFGPSWAVLALLVAIVLLGLTVYAEMVLLPRTRFGRGLVVQSTAGQAVPPLAADGLVGRTALAETTLAPSGYVVVEGRRYEAFCQSGHAAKGAALRVVGVRPSSLVVVLAS